MTSFYAISALSFPILSKIIHSFNALSMLSKMLCASNISEPISVPSFVFQRASYLTNCKKKAITYLFHHYERYYSPFIVDFKISFTHCSLTLVASSDSNVTESSGSSRDLSVSYAVLKTRDGD